MDYQMDYQKALQAAQDAANHAGNCRVLWVDQACNVWDDPSKNGYSDNNWVCSLKGDYPGAVSWIVPLD